MTRKELIAVQKTQLNEYSKKDKGSAAVQRSRKWDGAVEHDMNVWKRMQHKEIKRTVMH